jgi:hypothetical protein
MAEPGPTEVAPGQRLRVIFHPNDHGPGHADPTSSIEEFQSVDRALDQLAGRVRFQRGLFYGVGAYGPPEPRYWPDGDDTGFMDVWVVDAFQERGQEPSIPDSLWQRWTWGDDGQIHREDYDPQAAPETITWEPYRGFLARLEDRGNGIFGVYVKGPVDEFTELERAARAYAKERLTFAPGVSGRSVSGGSEGTRDGEYIVQETYCTRPVPPRTD